MKDEAGMSDRTHWLCLFNPTTWSEFVEAGATVMGFPETRKRVVQRIKPGDRLYAYMTKVSRWVAVLEVTSDPYVATEPTIWKQGAFPCRVKVRVVAEVPVEQGVPVLSLSKDLRLFDNMKTPNWGLLFRVAPRELHREDGERITQAIEQAAQQVETGATEQS